tara:strand:+ start:760 stop:1338 length:579 start_codon:yes stop_codon:yes gene_type:complete
MKNFLAILILIFSLQSWTNADDIFQFEIEGMSVGESALKYFEKQYLKDGIVNKGTFKYKDNKFVSIGTVKNYEIYESVGLIIMPDDDNFEIHGLEGTLYFGDNIDKCYEKQKTIEKDIDNLLGDKIFKQNWDSTYKYDTSGKSKVKYIDYIFKDNSSIRLVCYDMDKDFADPTDQLSVVVNSKEFMNFLDNL